MSRSAYVRAARGGRSPSAVAEVWLRGNVRPVLWVGVPSCGLVAAILAASPFLGAGPVVVGVLAAMLAATAVVVAALAVVASGPRVGRSGDALLVRLAPGRATAVPLAVVECVFPGSQPVTGPILRHTHAADADADGGPSSERRVGTLVIRFAERATEWRERPTFAPWGTWHDGHVVVDGRWCEPLSADLARSISQHLLEAKREVVTAEAGR